MNKTQIFIEELKTGPVTSYSLRKDYKINCANSYMNIKKLGLESVKRYTLTGKKNKKSKINTHPVGIVVFYWIDGDELKVIDQIQKISSQQFISWKDVVTPIFGVELTNLLKNLYQKYTKYNKNHTHDDFISFVKNSEKTSDLYNCFKRTKQYNISILDRIVCTYNRYYLQEE